MPRDFSFDEEIDPRNFQESNFPLSSFSSTFSAPSLPHFSAPTLIQRGGGGISSSPRHHEDLGDDAQSENYDPKGKSKKKTLQENGEESSNRLKQQLKHNESERRRQQSINDAILRLKQLVPGCDEPRISKASVLSRSITYIEFIKSQLQRLKIENRSLKEHGSHGGRSSLSFGSGFPPTSSPSLSSSSSDQEGKPSSSSLSPVAPHSLPHPPHPQLPLFPPYPDIPHLTEEFSDSFRPELAAGADYGQGGLDYPGALEVPPQLPQPHFPQLDSFSILMPHGVQQPSLYSGDYVQDTFVALFLGVSFFALFSDSVIAPIASATSTITSRALQGSEPSLSQEPHPEGSWLWYLFFMLVKVSILYLMAKYGVEFRSLSEKKRNHDLELARRYRYMGEVAIYFNEPAKAQNNFLISLSYIGENVGYLPNSSTFRHGIQTLTQIFFHILHSSPFFLWLDNTLMKMRGNTAACREAKLALIGLYNSNRHLKSIDIECFSIILTATNLAECLDPHSQRSSSIYTLLGTALAEYDALRPLSHYYFNRGVETAKEHGPLAVENLRVLRESSTSTFPRQKEALTIRNIGFWNYLGANWLLACGVAIQSVLVAFHGKPAPL